MADFCRQCSVACLGEDFGDLKGLSTPEDTAAEKFVDVLCEGCGPTYVDHEGICHSPRCTHQHGAQSGSNPV